MMDSLVDFKNTIDSLVDTNIDKRGITRFVSAKVTSVNVDNTVNVYLPPDTTKTLSNVLNKTGELLSVGDSVELCTKNGKINNAWVALKHGTNLLGDFLPLSGGTVTGATTFQSDVNVSNTYGSFDLRDSNWGNNTSLNDYMGDINDLTTSGWFPTGGSNANLPSATPYLILVMVKNPTYYIRQIALERGGLIMWTRYKIDPTTWSSWALIPTSENNLLYMSTLLNNILKGGDMITYTPANMASMSAGATASVIDTTKTHVWQTDWTNHDSYNAKFPGCLGVYIKGGNQSSGGIALMWYYEGSMMFNIRVDGNRWSGWQLITSTSIS